MKYDFLSDIINFNEMYKMPENANFDWKKRLIDFKDIIEEEANEAYDILNMFGNETSSDLDVKTEVADLLGDIIIYCASEAQRWDIPIEQVLNIIMDSNFSKLGIDGLPIYDDRNKLLKGPNYWRPQAKIRELLEKGNK